MIKYAAAIIFMALLVAPTYAHSLTLDELVVECVSIPVEGLSPKKLAWIENACPSNLWTVSDDGREIICEFDRDGEHITTIRRLAPN